MKFERETNAGRNAFTAYGEGWVEVSGTRHTASLAVAAERLLPGWAAGGVATLTAGEVEALVGLGAEIVLIGSGRAFAFPDPEVLAPLHRAGIGVEVMDTRAACRTYNILLAEGRAVVAALILD